MESALKCLNLFKSTTMKKSIFRFALAFIFFSNAFGSTDMKIAMLEVDKYYFPVVYNLYNNDLVKAKSSLSLLQKEFVKFKSKLNEESEYCAFEFFLNEAEESLSQCHSSLRYSDYNKTIFLLDKYRDQFVELRYKCNIDYVFDYLWDFEIMVEILNSSINHSPECEEDWSEYSRFCNEMLKSWNCYLNLQSEFRYVFTERELKGLYLYQQQLQVNLIKLISFIEIKEWDSIVVQSELLVSDYINLLETLGGETLTYGFVNN